jgi:predicted RNase H-like HicB family nuclease
MIQYPAIIDGELGAYGVVIPDMPGACCAMGRTVDEALSDASEALADFVDDLKAQGKSLPAPSSVRDLELHPGEMIALVKAMRKRLVTAKVAASELGVSDGSVRHLCLAGLIAGAERNGRDWLIPSPVVRYALPRGRRPIDKPSELYT